jgi:hypothetical protein
MGAWGYRYDESDTYLDRLYSVTKPLMEYIEDPRNTQADVLASVKILHDIYAAGNFYPSDLPRMMVAEAYVDGVLADPKAFDAWDDPAARRREVEKLREEVHCLNKKGPRSTTLIKKIQESQERGTGPRIDGGSEDRSL